MDSQALELQTIAWLLTYALHSTVLLGAAYLIGGRFWKGSERASELVWKAALVGGLMTASVQQFVQVEPLSGRFAIGDPAEVSATSTALVQAPAEAPAHAPAAGPLGGPPGAQPAGLGALSNEQLLELADRYRREVDGLEQGRLATPDAHAGAGSGLGASLSRRWTSLALIGWGIGGGLLMLLTLLAWRRLRDHLAGRTRIDEGPLTLEVEALRAKAGMWRKVRLFSSDRLSAPIATGVLFPQICLPARSLVELDRDEQRGMLAHELAHIARLDPLWLSIGQLVQTLLFFQPLNRLARRRIEFSAEMLCDAQAVDWTGERVALARCLTKVAGWVVAGRRDLPACAMAHLRSPLGARVQGILQHDARLRRAGRWVWPSTAALLAGTWMVVPGFASPQLVRLSPTTSTLLDGSARRSQRDSGESHDSMPAPARRALEATPEEADDEPRASDRRASATGPRADAAPAAELAQMLGLQVEGLDALEGEIAELRERMQQQDADQAAWSHLLEIEHRVSRVRALGSRVHDILKELNSPHATRESARTAPSAGDHR